MMIDFHAHIIPGMDDGAKTPQVAVEMVKQAAAQGIDTIIGTPHFNFEEVNLPDFLRKRAKSLEILEQNMEKAGITDVKIIPGAEVYLMPGTADRENLSELCIEGTNCMLVEMPVGRWTGWVFHELYKMRHRDIVPVLAHLERYISYKENIEKIEKLLEMEVCVQINADDISGFRYRKIIRHFASVCNVLVLGSDTHDPIKRPSRIEKAKKVLRRKYGERFVRSLEYNANMLVFGEFSF